MAPFTLPWTLRRIAPRAFWKLGFAAATAVVAWLPGCGSTHGNSGPCNTVYKGKCGGACTTDSTCGAGLYCGPQGTCTADCETAGAACGDKAGYVCTSTGRCNGGSLFTSVGSNITDASACLVERRQGEGLPADIYIMNDQSHSMACTIPTGGDRWTAMKTALEGFMKSDGAAGLGVGIQYFGQGQQGASCNVADYTPPDVEIAALPGNASALIASLDGHRPYTLTPTPAAIDGALAHAKQWATAHTDHAVSLVLATDGEPNACGNAADRIGSVVDSVAAALAGTPKIQTYVIGIIGGSAAMAGQGCQYDPAPPNQPDLDRVAQAGGTDKAYIVDAINGDTSAQFLDALNRIRGAAVIGCEYVLPKTTADGQQIDPHKVNVTYAAPGGTERDLAFASDVNVCDGTNGGWYYDDQTTPTKILLCPATCNAVKAEPKSSIGVLLGCDTQVTTPT